MRGGNTQLQQRLLHQPCILGEAVGEYREPLLQLCLAPPRVPQELTASKYSLPGCRKQIHRSSWGVTFLAGL